MQADYRVDSLFTDEELGEVFAKCYDNVYGEEFEKYLGNPDDYYDKLNASTLLNDSMYEMSDEVRDEIATTFGLSDFDSENYDELIYDGNANGISTEDDELEFVDKRKGSYIKGEDDYGFDEYDVKESFNLREALNRIDLKTGNKYDLRNLYESCELSEDEKRVLANIVYDQNDPSVIYDTLNDRFLGKEIKMPERVKDGVIHEDANGTYLVEGAIWDDEGDDDDGINEFNEVFTDVDKMINFVLDAMNNAGTLDIINLDTHDSIHLESDMSISDDEYRDEVLEFVKSTSGVINEGKSNRFEVEGAYWDEESDEAQDDDGIIEFKKLFSDVDEMIKFILFAMHNAGTLDITNLSTGDTHHLESDSRISDKEYRNEVLEFIKDSTGAINEEMANRFQVEGVWYPGEDEDGEYIEEPFYFSTNDTTKFINFIWDKIQNAGIVEITVDGHTADPTGEISSKKEIYQMMVELSDDGKIEWSSNESLKEDINTTDLKSKLESAISNAVKEIGYDDEFINDYIFVEVKEDKFYDGDPAIKCEIRTELSYDECFELAHKLNPIIEAEDKNAYFDMEDAHTLVAYLNPVPVAERPVDEEAVKSWTEVISLIKSMEELRRVYREILELYESDDSTFRLIHDAVMNKADELNKGLDESYDFKGLNRDLKKELPADEIDFHNSDLYVKATPKAKEIFKRYGIHNHPLVSTFIDNITHTRWFDLPFAYVPDEDDMGTYFDDVQPEFNESLKEDINDTDEILEFKRDVEAAESVDDIQWLIHKLSDGVAEDNVQRAFDANADAEDLQTVKDAVISELDIYLQDNEWLGESKSMNENNEDRVTIADLEGVSTTITDLIRGMRRRTMNSLPPSANTYGIGSYFISFPSKGYIDLTDIEEKYFNETEYVDNPYDYDKVTIPNLENAVAAIGNIINGMRERDIRSIVPSANTYGIGSYFISLGSKGYIDLTDIEETYFETELEESKSVNESVEVNGEVLQYAVINPDGTYAGVPCTSEEEARELASQRDGRIIVELGKDIDSINEGRMTDRYKKMVKDHYEQEIDHSDKSHEIADDGLSFKIVRADGTVLEYNAAEGYTTTKPNQVNEDTEDEEKPYTYRQVFDELKLETKNFTVKDGSGRYGFESEANDAVKILEKHYASVELDKAGSWLQVDFKDPKKGKKVNESSLTHSPLSTAGEFPYAVQLLFEMDKFVMDVYDNEGWLMNGVPDGEFEETTSAEAKANYTDHQWLIEDETGELDKEEFARFIEVFRKSTRSKDYDRAERERIIADAEELLK